MTSLNFAKAGITRQRQTRKLTFFLFKKKKKKKNKKNGSFGFAYFHFLFENVPEPEPNKHQRNVYSVALNLTFFTCFHSLMSKKFLQLSKLL